MTTIAAPVITTWEGPPWAEERMTDEDAVIYSRALGRAASLNGRDMLVELVQRDELSLSANTVSITRRPAYLRMAGEQVSPEAAARFAEILLTANQLIEPHPAAAEASRGSAATTHQDRIAS